MHNLQHLVKILKGIVFQSIELLESEIEPCFWLHYLCTDFFESQSKTTIAGYKEAGIQVNIHSLFCNLNESVVGCLVIWSSTGYNELVTCLSIIGGVIHDMSEV